MHVSSTLRLLGLLLLSLNACSLAIAIPENHSAIQARTASCDLNLAELAQQYSVPKITVHGNRPDALSPRGFKKVPGLPDGWKAVFRSTETIFPVMVSAKQLHTFYINCALAAANLDDRWRWTLQVGQLALQLTSRNRRNAIVTKELILATVLMLNEFAKGGFTDLFSASLWHEIDELRVDIQLRVVARAVEGTKAN